MPNNKMITAGSSVVAAIGLVATGAALANASTNTPTSTVTGSITSFVQAGELRGADGAGTAVTGGELAKVTKAVKAKDSAVSVTSVRKEADGSYKVFGTKAGSPVAFDVSKDLKTITAKACPGGPGGARGTAVTGSELAKVTAAVKAKDSAVAVSSVRKDADGSYDVLGAKAGAPVVLEVSKDLKTITTKARPGDGRGFGDHGSSGGSAQTAPSGTTPS